MKIDFNYTFKKLDGKAIRKKAKEGERKGKVFTLREASIEALLTPILDGTGRVEEIKGEEKVKRYQFAVRLHNSNGIVDLQSEEVTLLKKLIAKSYPPLTVGQAWEILDPAEKSPTC